MSAGNECLDVVILPPEGIARKAIALSRLLTRRFGSPLLLDRAGALPHISLYHIAVSRDRLSAFRERLRAIAARTEVGELHVVGIHIYREFGSIAIAISKPRWLQRLYLRIIHETSELRDTRFDNHRSWVSERLSPGERAWIDRYGTPLVGRFFIPHITLGIIRDCDQLQAAARVISLRHRGFKVTELAICRQGPHHTCTRVIERLALKNG